MDLKQKIGQLLMVGFQNNNLTEIEKLIHEYKFGNVILFKRNIKDKKQLKELNESIKKMILKETGVIPLIAIGQECGTVQRFSNDITYFPGNMAVGATENCDNAYTIGKMLALELKESGINMNIAPCVDINSNHQNSVIGARSYGDNPQLVAKMGMNMCLGMEDGGILPCIKHFPGYGDTASESRYKSPIIDKTYTQLCSSELIPFKYAIDRGIECVMAGHIVLNKIDPNTPATYSKAAIGGILRNAMGFKGMVITDCFEMKSISEGIGIGNAAALSILAGTDMVMISHHISNQQQAIEQMIKYYEKGFVQEKRIDESIARIMKIKAKYGEIKEEVYDQDKHKSFSVSVMKQAIRGEGIPFEDLKDTLFLGVKNSVNTIEEDVNPLSVDISEEMKRKFQMDTLAWEPDCKDIEPLIKSASAQKYKKIMVALSDACNFKTQRALYEALKESGKPIAVISMRTPYDVENLSPPDWHIYGYEYTPLSCKCIVEYIGEKLKK